MTTVVKSPDISHKRRRDSESLDIVCTTIDCIRACDTRRQNNSLRACEILNNVIRIPKGSSVFQCLPIALCQIYVRSSVDNINIDVDAYVNVSDTREENHPPDTYFIINEHGVDQVLSTVRLHKKALRACEILNNHIRFTDFQNISVFHCDPLALGKIRVQGPTYTYRTRNTPADPLPIMDNTTFTQHVVTYVDKSHITCKSYRDVAYFNINDDGVDQVLNSDVVKQIFPAENMLYPHRKPVIIASKEMTGLDMFINDPSFDPRLLDQISKFLP